MKARLETSDYRFLFHGSPALWNEFFRPLLGGPEAPPEPAPAAPPRAAAPPPPAFAAIPSAPSTTTSPAPAPAVAATWNPPRPVPVAPRPAPYAAAPPYPRQPSPEPRTWHRRPGGLEPTIAVEPSADPRTLYDRLANVESRRGERDAVLAAIWFLGKGEGDVSPEDVERHLREHDGPPDVKVRPVMLKHVTRTKLLEQGTTPGTVRLTAKGVAQVRMLVGV
jgi:hypothetical protein